MSKKPTRPTVHFIEDFHWPTSATSSVTFHAGYTLEVDQAVADAAVPAMMAELINGDVTEPLPALESEIEEGE
jgi:hypothetical protein